MSIECKRCKNSLMIWADKVRCSKFTGFNFEMPVSCKYYKEKRLGLSKDAVMDMMIDKKMKTELKKLKLE